MLTEIMKNAFITVSYYGDHWFYFKKPQQIHIIKSYMNLHHSYNILHVHIALSPLTGHNNVFPNIFQDISLCSFLLAWQLKNICSDSFQGSIQAVSPLQPSW